MPTPKTRPDFQTLTHLQNRFLLVDQKCHSEALCIPPSTFTEGCVAFYLRLCSGAHPCRDGLGDITERHPDLNVPLEEHGATSHPQLRITDQTGPAVVLDLVKSRPSRSVTYLALGPLTTLAQVMLAGGELIRDRIGRVVCLGGALDVPGNTTPVAECEVHCLNIEAVGD
jgi:hypothetical protein